MNLVLDTNILIALERKQRWAIDHYREAIVSGVVMSVPAIIRYESRRGLLRAEYTSQLFFMDALLSFLPTLDFDQQSADIAADIYQQLRLTGTLIEDADLLIAATAIRHDATLVTRNIKHFQRIPGLLLADWQQE